MIQMLQSGGAAKVIINGIVIGFATSLSFSRSISTKFIYGIDSPIAQEIAPTTYSVQGNLNGLRIRSSGGLDGVGAMDISSLQKLFNFKYATIEVVDRVSNETFYTIQNVVFEQDSWTIQAKSLITFSASFKGKFVTNESSNK